MKKLGKSEEKLHLLFSDFIRYTASPWRIAWMNFLMGVMRGLGTVIGVTVVIGLFVWILSLFSTLPVIGEYSRIVKSEITDYIDKTNYSDNFQHLEQLVEEINNKLPENKNMQKEINQMTDQTEETNQTTDQAKQL